MRDLLEHGLLSAGEEGRLARAARGGDARARERLVLHNLRLVASLVQRHSPAGTVEDRMQDGIVGLLKAVDRFDPARGNRFSTYATWWIRKELLAAVEHDRLVRLPRREPATDGTRERALAAALEPARLDAPIRSEDGSQRTLADAVLGTARDAHDEVADAERRHAVDAAVHRLSRLARDALRLRFGFGDGTERSHAEVARELGVSREKVRLVHNAALAELAERPDVRALDPTLAA